MLLSSSSSSSSSAAAAAAAAAVTFPFKIFSISLVLSGTTRR
uniref:Uncharacterized protein n=1 Tax=Nelumbo nucifera TaxID=4432 RepID=A0A822ZXW3_NELNU|nr:TPA_asm: hypothetical protein HUJ06_017956 [Nelumbo nucifera]